VKRPGPDSNPAFSPDGKWVAFFSGDGRVNDWPGHRTEICVVPAAGGPVRNLTRAADLEADDFAWTPDSASILFAAQETLAHLAHNSRLTGRTVCRVRCWASNQTI